ncbi:MAG: hypothetical protein Q8Q17_00255 [bacterium]|nr:hypothetical protein [bacterium]
MSQTVVSPKPFHEAIVDEANSVNSGERVEWTERELLIAATVLVEVTKRSILPKNHDAVQEGFEVMFAELGVPVPKNLFVHIAAEKERCAREAYGKVLAIQEEAESQEVQNRNGISQYEERLAMTS